MVMLYDTGEDRQELLRKAAELRALADRLGAQLGDATAEIAELKEIRDGLVLANEELTSKHDRLLEDLEGIAMVAHCGGLDGMSQDDALIAIRRSTVSYWDKSATREQTVAVIARLKGRAE